MRDKKVLDNTSSVPVALKVRDRKRGAKRRMRAEYEIEYRGKKIKCSSLSAAVELLQKLDMQDHPQARPWDVDEFVEFTNRLEFQPKRLLAFLLNKNENRLSTDTELRTHLGLYNNQALAGVLSGVTKVAKALEIEPGRVYTQSTSYEKGKPIRYYCINKMFRNAAEQHDWPTLEEITPCEDDSPLGDYEDDA